MASGQAGRQPDVAMDAIEHGMTTPPEYRTSDLPDLDSNTDASARQRSSSPWAFTLSTKAVNRVRSNEGSGVSTPIGRYGRVPYIGAAAAPRQAAQRAGYESALLAAVRKQMDALEEKLGNQISRIQSQSDRLREAAFSRLEEKMSIAEGLQPKLDRRIAELSGHFKGLSEEMQSQIRRVDMMDERLWEWRHQMEEEFQRKYMEFDNHVQKVSSSSRMMHSSLEDAHKKHLQRLHRLESDFNDRMGAREDTREGLFHLHSRLEAVEQRRGLSEEDFAPRDLLPARQEHLNLSEEVEHHAGVLAMFEKHVADMSDKVEQLFQDSIDLHTTSKEQEVELKTLRTLIDTREEHHRMLSERVERADWEGKFEQVRQTLQDDQRRKAETFEKMEMFTNRLEMQEQAYDELRSRHDQMLRRHRDLNSVQVELPFCDGLDTFAADGLTPQRAVDGVAGITMEDCMARLDVVEHRMSSIDPDVNLWPQVGILVSQLKEISPKVIEHEQRLAKLDAMRNTPPQRADTADPNSVDFAKIRVHMEQMLPEIQRHAVTREELISTTEHHVSKEEFRSGIQLVKTSLQEMCRDSDKKLRRDFQQAMNSPRDKSTVAELQSPRDTAIRHFGVRTGSEEPTRLGNSSPSPAKEDLQKLRNELTEKLEAAAETTGSLRQDHLDLHGKIANIEEALAGAAEVNASRHRREFDEMRCQISSLQERARDASRCRNGDDSQGAAASARLTEEVAALRAAFEEITNCEDSGASPLDDLLLAVQQDEELEQEKQRRLLERIDEVCERLGEVTNGGYRSPLQVNQIACASSAERGSAANGIPAELSTKLEALADRVEAQSQRCIELHTKLQGKFTQMAEVVETHVSRTA
mmetsp:Transcript_144245/g.250239  ORF Transcript_144245/g.250239 Transcript_144245/m.250239 type:complete len:866 (-) Transcript_144245:136-2733(-)